MDANPAPPDPEPKPSLVSQLRAAGHDEFADRIEQWRLSEQRKARSRKQKRKQANRSRRKNR